MKAADVKSEMDGFLLKIGLTRGNILWQRGRLVLIIAGEVHEFRLPSGMSRKSLAFEMGWIGCLCKLNGIEPPKARKANGHDQPVTRNHAG